MKGNNLALMLIFGFVSTFLLSCQKEPPVTPINEKGTLILDIGLQVQVDEVDSRLKSVQAIEDFRVIIYHAEGTEAMTFETASAMPDTVKLAPGDYYVEAHSDNNLPAAFENPYYYGVSQVFSITSNMQQTVQVTCVLSNTVVSVTYSETIMNSFSDYSTIVSTSLDSLIFVRDETRWGYFQTMPLNILVELIYLNPDGSENNKTLSGAIADPLANRHYSILVNASIDEGMSSFQLLLDSTEIPVELIEISDDPEIPTASAVEYGELLITEIMCNPEALSDTEGEWFEIYNNSDRAINLRNLVLDRDGTNRHTISDSIELSPGEFYIMARTATAVTVSNHYVYGSSITLSNTGAVLSIYNEDTETESGTVIFSVDYGAVNFPSGSGTSISLNPYMLNFVDAILGTSWCISTSIYSTGDSGTPGTMNDPCL